VINKLQPEKSLQPMKSLALSASVERLLPVGLSNSNWLAQIGGSKTCSSVTCQNGYFVIQNSASTPLFNTYDDHCCECPLATHFTWMQSKGQAHCSEVRIVPIKFKALHFALHIARYADLGAPAQQCSRKAELLHPHCSASNICNCSVAGVRRLEGPTHAAVSRVTTASGESRMCTTQYHSPIPLRVALALLPRISLTSITAGELVVC
jgi:hypothetical protein